jgi:hypothetical protein
MAGFRLNNQNNATALALLGLLLLARTLFFVLGL